EAQLSQKYAVPTRARRSTTLPRVERSARARSLMPYRVSSSLRSAASRRRCSRSARSMAARARARPVPSSSPPRPLPPSPLPPPRPRPAQRLPRREGPVLGGAVRLLARPVELQLVAPAGLAEEGLARRGQCMLLGVGDRDGRRRPELSLARRHPGDERRVLRG